jgi:hypothetical protein
MRFELLAGDEWVGQYPSRRVAMADAELRAAKRGQRVRWSRRDADGQTLGHLEPETTDAVFIVRRHEERA